MSGGVADRPLPGAARAAVERCLARIEQLDPVLNAMAATTAERARDEADACDRAAAEGRWLGLLHGMPIALKDNIETAGVRTTSGAAYLADHIPNRDAPVVGRLKAQGAVLIGKANMQELAWGVVSTNPVFGQCRNPWNPERIPGGSSGGSGATVAAEMADAALGTDTGGSVRIPASMTGIAGLRPTHGRISIRGITPVSVAHDTVGPMARSVADVARLFAALAAYDPLDPVSRDLPLDNFLPRLDDGIEGVRIGLARNFFFESVDAEVEAAVRAGAGTLESLGAHLVDVTLPGAETAQRWTTIMAYADACAYHKERLDAGPGALSEAVYERMIMGREFSAVDYAEAMRGREAWRRALAQVFETVDVLLAPTTPRPAPPIADDRNLHRATQDATRFTYGGALASIPGLSVPCGFSSDGLPIGMMLEAAWGRSRCCSGSVTPISRRPTGTSAERLALTTREWAPHRSHERYPRRRCRCACGRGRRCGGAPDRGRGCGALLRRAAGQDRRLRGPHVLAARHAPAPPPGVRLGPRALAGESGALSASSRSAGERRSGATRGTRAGRRLARQPALFPPDRRRAGARMAPLHRAAGAPDPARRARVGARCAGRRDPARPPHRSGRRGRAALARRAGGVPRLARRRGERLRGDAGRGCGPYQCGGERRRRRIRFQEVYAWHDVARPATAQVLVQNAAIAGFPLGSGAGALWYGVFPAAAPAALSIGLTGGLLAAGAVIGAFSGVVSDPIQRRLGLHHRRLRRLIDCLERELTGQGDSRFTVRDHYVARTLDLIEVLGLVWRAAR